MATLNEALELDARLFHLVEEAAQLSERITKEPEQAKELSAQLKEKQAEAKKVAEDAKSRLAEGVAMGKQCFALRHRLYKAETELKKARESLESLRKLDLKGPGQAP